MICRTREAPGLRRVQSHDNGHGRGHALRHHLVADNLSLSPGSARGASRLQRSSEFMRFPYRVVRFTVVPGYHTSFDWTYGQHLIHVFIYIFLLSHMDTNS